MNKKIKELIKKSSEGDLKSKARLGFEYWSGKKIDQDFNLAMSKIEKELNKIKSKSKKKHRAHFCCALSLCFPTGKIISFQGRVYGYLQFPPKGLNGFGYDSIFIPDVYRKTFGEMNFSFKEKISHRQIAFNKLKKYLIKI